MVTVYGMSEKLGTILLSSSNGEVFLGRDIAQHRECSEETFKVIDQEVKAIIDKAYSDAKKILQDNMDKLEAVAQVLMEKEKIDGDEFTAIMEGRPIENKDENEEQGE